MTIETALVTKLEAAASVIALVGDRIFPNRIPQGVGMPAIAYEQLSGPRDHVMDGNTGLANTNYIFKCSCAIYAQAKAVSEAVRIELDGFRGTVGGIAISCIMLEDEKDEPETRPGTDELMRFVKVLNFKVAFQETTT